MKTATLTDRPLSLTEARKVLGDMLDAAFNSASPVRIQRGNRIVRLVPEVLPEPVEVYPEGSITIDSDRADSLNHFPSASVAPQIR